MSKILMLALAPMRKNKGQTVSLFVFALITALLLNIGLVLLFGIGSFFDERAEANNAPHFLSLLYSGTDSETQGRRFIENDPRVAQYEETEAVGGFGEYAINGVNVMNGILFSRVDATQKMDAPSFIGEHLPLTGDRIYIPYHIFTAADLRSATAFRCSYPGPSSILRSRALRRQ